MKGRGSAYTVFSIPCKLRGRSPGVQWIGTRDKIRVVGGLGGCQDRMQGAGPLGGGAVFCVAFVSAISAHGQTRTPTTTVFSSPPPDGRPILCCLSCFLSPLCLTLSTHQRHYHLYRRMFPAKHLHVAIETFPLFPVRLRSGGNFTLHCRLGGLVSQSHPAPQVKNHTSLFLIIVYTHNDPNKIFHSSKYFIFKTLREIATKKPRDIPRLDPGSPIPSHSSAPPVPVP